MVFYHRSLPLSVSLRRVVKGAGDQEVDLGQEFQKLLQNVYQSLNSETPGFLDEAWDYEYDSLFFDGIGPRQKWRFPFLPPEQQISFLRTRTYWYRRLKPNCKRMVKCLVNQGKILHLKEILHTVDGMVNQMIMSFPECLMTADDEDPYYHTDRIINNIVSNCLFNYPQAVRMIRDYRKELKKHAFLKESMPVSNRWRGMSWMNNISRSYNTFCMTNSRSKMFRIGTFCQSRSTGLASGSMVEETIEQFIETVTKKVDFSPDPLLVKARDTVIDRVVNNAEGTSAHFRMSMSTSGCTENGRSKEGKFGFLRNQIREGNFSEPPDFQVTNRGGELGTPLWDMSLEKADSGSVDIYKVNIAGVRENGKVRVVTSGSFYKETLLQPFSHLTIEMAKSEPILRDGFRARRLGYSFIEGINILDPLRGDVIFESDPIAVSCDWEKATDNPPHESGYFVMRPLLAAVGLDPRTVENVLDTWLGNYDMFYKGQFVGKMVNGIPMGNPLTKTNLSLAHPICDVYAKLRIQHEISSGSLVRDWKKGNTGTINAGNGDDLVFFAWGQFKHEYVQYYSDAAVMLGYKRSELDFFVTSDWCTYCEEIFRIPTSRYDTVALANRLKHSGYSPALDFPKGRLLVDTQKDRSDFSSEPEGKFTLLGKEMEYVRKDSGKGVNFLYAVASALQDVGLGLRYREVPVYIPREIYSIGKMPPQWHLDSWVNAMNSTKRVWVRNLTQTVIEEFNGTRDVNVIALRGARTSGQKHFVRESYLEIREIPDSDPIKQYRMIKASDWELFPVGCIEKLSGAGLLVRESQITKHYLFHQRIKSLSQDIGDKGLFQVIKRIGSQLAEYEESRFRLEGAKFIKSYSARPWTLRNSMPEDLYPESIGKVLADADPLRVDLDLPYLKRFCKRAKPDSPYTRELDKLYEWFVDNYLAVLNGEDYEMPPTAIIEDDPIILQTVRNLILTGCKLIVYVTDDKKLVSKARNQNLGALHLRLSCRDWISFAGDESRVLEAVTGFFKDPHAEVIIDSGSLETYMDKTGSSYSLGVPYTESTPPGWTHEIVRPAAVSNMDMLKAYRRRPTVSNDDVIGAIRYCNRNDKITMTQFTRAMRGA